MASVPVVSAPVAIVSVLDFTVSVILKLVTFILIHFQSQLLAHSHSLVMEINQIAATLTLSGTVRSIHVHQPAECAGYTFRFV